MLKNRINMGNCIYSKEIHTDLQEEKQDVQHYHTMNQTSHFTVRYPDHPPRTVSPTYRKTHAELCHSSAQCFLCGKLQSKEDPLESHHFYCEKAAESAVDWEKFGQRANKLFHIETGVCIGTQFDWSKVAIKPEIFVDSVHNMIVLCRQHHTSSNKGIHHIPFPVWILQLEPKDGFSFL